MCPTEELRWACGPRKCVQGTQPSCGLESPQTPGSVHARSIRFLSLVTSPWTAAPWFLPLSVVPSGGLSTPQGHGLSVAPVVEALPATATLGRPASLQKHPEASRSFYALAMCSKEQGEQVGRGWRELGNVWCGALSVLPAAGERLLNVTTGGALRGQREATNPT